MSEPRKYTQEEIDAMMDDFSEDCWQCGGEGGWNSCMEDCCPMIGGEEGCDDPRCWRRCDVCNGTGTLKAPSND